MTARHPGNVCVADIIGIMEHLAPPRLAEEWDNCGLQVGSTQWPVHHIWVALDPLPAVVRSAAQAQVDLLITHHPLIMRPLHVIDADTLAGQVIETALTARMAVYSAHTNLDSAKDGVNDVLARTIGLAQLAPMVPSAPQEGDPGECSDSGMGRVGVLEAPLTLADLADEVKRRLDLPVIKIAGDPCLLVHRVAVCSGSGSSLLDAFLDTTAEVYVSGDMRYHDARRVEDAGRALIDVGHFPSEQLVIPPLVERLRQAVQKAGWRVQVAFSELERDPFVMY